MRLALKVGDEVPRDRTYDSDRLVRAFNRASYAVGRDYKDAFDDRGKPMLWKHDREKPESFDRRKLTTNPRNHAGPVVRRYNDFVFRSDATRPEAGDELYDLMRDDCDGNGTPLVTFMRAALLTAQVDRDAFILADSTKNPDAGELSIAQARDKGVRSVLRLIDADAVLWTYYSGPVLCEVLVLLKKDDGTIYARWWDEKNTADVSLEQPKAPDAQSWKLKVTGVGAERAHGYDGCPIVAMRPQFDDVGTYKGEAQIFPLAKAQQKIFNDLSLLSEEIYNVCFSQIVATGVSADSVKNVEFGSARLLCLPNPEAKFDVIGADPAQATSIRQSIEDEQRELYRIAGVNTGDPIEGPSAPESGVAKAFRFNDLAANLAALAKAAEGGENAALDRVFSPTGRPKPGAVGYPNDFDLPVLADELSNTIRVLTVQQFPDVLKKHMIRRFADRSLTLDEAEAAELKTELDAFATPDPTTAFGGVG